MFDSEDTSSDATTPQFTISNLRTFQRGEKITGGSSGAVARIISTTSPITYVFKSTDGSTDFTASETITGALVVQIQQLERSLLVVKSSPVTLY